MLSNLATVGREWIRVGGRESGEPGGEAGAGSGGEPWGHGPGWWVLDGEKWMGGGDVGWRMLRVGVGGSPFGWSDRLGGPAVF